jgi:hypothetical protein
MTNEETSALQNMGAIPNNNIPKCPKCGSTAVSTGARGFNIVTGIFRVGTDCKQMWQLRS